MKDFGSYTCTVARQQNRQEGKVTITEEGLEFTCDSEHFFLDFAYLMDFRLKEYHLFLETTTGQVELSMLGKQTETFFERLWEAYNNKCTKALFVTEDTRYEGEGDYAYTEQGVVQQGIAKIALYDSCLVLYPHDRYARRIPLCFCKEPVTADFQLSLESDTGDTYRIGRIGRYSQEVFDRIVRLRSEVATKWREAHLELEQQLPSKLGPAQTCYEIMASCGGRMVSGLFSLETEGFWFANLHPHKAVVELVTNEQTATYLYQFPTDPQLFEYALRHAMESVALHREVIFTDIADKPLYQMSVDRNYHVAFLREHNAGRIIHSGSWEQQLRAFLS